MEEQVPFKVFTFWTENGQPEVRRFGVERSMVTSFVYLNAKLQEIFPGLQNKTYFVTWKDEEGDNVTVSSDDELMTALTGMRADLIKLNVYCKDTEAKEDDCDADIVFTAVSSGGDAKNAVHIGVICDNCDSQVVGFRYKCISCDDYDLCTKCEGMGLHSEHCMVRVPSPSLPRTVIKAAIKRSRHFLKTVASAVATEECPYKRNKRDKSGDRKHREDRHGHHGDYHRGERHHRRPRSSWLETFATYMNEFANLAGDIDLDPPRGAESQAQNPQTSQDQPQAQASQEQEKTPNGQAKAPKQPEFNTTSGPAPKPQNISGCPFGKAPFGQTLQGKACIETLQKMFGDRAKAPNQSESTNAAGQQTPFGLAQLHKLFEMYVGDMAEFEQPRPSTSASNDASVNTSNVDTNNASVNTGDVEMTNGEKQAEAEKQSNLISLDTDKVSIRSESGSSHSSGSSNRDESPDKADDWTMINKEKDLMDAMKQGASEQPPAPGFNLPEEFHERVKISESQSLYPPLNTATAVLNPKAPERPQPTAPLQPQRAQPQPGAAQSQPAQALPKPAPQPQPQARPRPSHPKAHIAAAIDQMIAMGFTNDGGWLTQLLENKDGNIAAVLDLLTPVSPKK